MRQPLVNRGFWASLALAAALGQPAWGQEQKAVGAIGFAVHLTPAAAAIVRAQHPAVAPVRPRSVLPMDDFQDLVRPFVKACVQSGGQVATPPASFTLLCV